MKLWFFPLLAYLVFIPFSGELDLLVSNYFYVDGVGFPGNQLCYFLYDWGFTPAVMVAGASGVIFTLSFFKKKLQNLRAPCLIIGLTMLIGTTTVHATKDVWVRPRPKQTENYGGFERFQPMYKPFYKANNPPCRSFSSGHASVGFFFFALYFAGRLRKNKILMKTGMIVGILWGVLLSYSRLAMGAHYLSDTVTSAVVMWFTSYFLYLWILRYERAYTKTVRNT